MDSKENFYLGKFPLLGFKSEVNIITLDKSHIIRKCTKKEIQDLSNRIKISNHKSFEYILYYSYSSKEDSMYSEEIFGHFQILNVFFKILKQGSIGIPYCNRYIKDKDGSFQSIGFASDPHLYYFEEEPYNISVTETYQLKKLWLKYINQFSAEKAGFQTAVRRFYYSTQRHDNEDKIIDIMIAFEALFLNENAELSFKLSLRVAKFLDDRYDSFELFEFMKKAYNIRSKIAHGDIKQVSDDKKRKNDLETISIIKRLDQVLRQSLRKYVADYSDTSKSEFINNIDNIIISGTTVK